jgi:medium-chain acyl-[acyl-carrier-protein] hydrolase
MSASQSALWFFRPKPIPQPAVRLYCFPHAAGAPLLYKDWPAGLPVGVEMNAILLPGRGKRLREPLYRRMKPLVRDLIEVLLPELNGERFVLFGHSLGGLIAYELAQTLRAEMQPPAALFVSACHAPQRVQDSERLHDLPRVELLTSVQRLNGIPPELLAEEELIDLMLPTLRADLAVYESYDYQDRDPLTCPLIVCGGQDDLRVTPPELAEWRAQAAGDYEFHLFAGDHFYLNQARPQLTNLIGRVLAL